MIPRITVLAAAIVMTGCSNGADGARAASTSEASDVALDQKNLCEVSAWQHDDVARACKPGQKVVYLPQTFGNEQLPIFFAAVNCDLRYSVALTSGAVTCIYAPITPKPNPPEEEATKPTR